MTNSAHDELLPVRVPTRPSLLVKPDIASTAIADDTIELCSVAGLDLDEWQQHDLRIMMGQKRDGRWAAFEHTEVVARQNGKGSILEARELGGLFLAEERLILHSAHLAVTSSEAFHRLLNLIEDCPDLDRQVKRVSRSSQDQSIETKRGARCLFKTRTRGSGRGLTADAVILDEAMVLFWPQMAALLPTLSARPNAQVVYASSAATSDSEVLHKLRRRALAGDEDAFGYCEYSPPDGVDADADDPQTWADANPALGIRISLDYLRQERLNLPAAEFGRERLTLFDDDHSVSGSWAVIDEDSWVSCTQPDSTIVSPVALAVEVDRARTWAVVAAAGRNAAGQFHIEIVESREGVGWVVDRVADLVDGHSVAAVVVDAAGPAGFLAGQLSEAGVDVSAVSARDAAAGCGLFVTSSVSNGLAHLGDPALSAAVQRASQRVSGDVWFWTRTGERESIELIAGSLAVGRVPSLSDAVSAPVYAY